MPYVNVQVIRGSVTREQKARMVAEITRTLHEVPGKRPEHTPVVIFEIEPDDWGFAGMLTRRRRRDRQR